MSAPPAILQPAINRAFAGLTQARDVFTPQLSSA